ncbi:MAG: HRDC domain-containing protein [Alphaproteobacteria bacterium]|nr:HRDC domain-containing protein [Alphaproteobacteria bacterium]
MEIPHELITSTARLEEALGDLDGPIAVDTEFHSERHYYPRLKLVQLCATGGVPLLVDPKSIRDLKPIGAALSGRTLIVHALSQDLPLLVRHTGLEPGLVIDPQVLAGFSGYGYPRGLTELVSRVLGETLPSGVSLSNWGQRPLSDEQLSYAAADVIRLHALAEALQEALPEHRQSWAADATAELAAQSLRGPDGVRMWRYVPGAAVLDGRGRALFQRLVEWREALARSYDQPRWQVASDAALLDIARRRPNNLSALTENRRLPKRLSRELAPRVLSMVAEVEALPEERLPPSVAVRRESAMAEALLTAWAHGVEVERDISAALALPQRLRRDLVLHWREPRWPEALQGWRERAFGDELRALLAGEISLTIIRNSKNDHES